MKTTHASFFHKPILLALFAAMAGLRAYSQTTSFTYQGRLNNGATAVNGIYDFTFSVFPASSGGSALAGPVTNTVAVSNGLFAVTLDFGAGVFPGADRWLEIGVRTNGRSEERRVGK